MTNEKYPTKNLKMTPLMKILKSGHRKAGRIDVDDIEYLKNYRKYHDAVSQMATSTIKSEYITETIDGMEMLWSVPDKQTDNERVILYCHGGGFTIGGVGYASVLSGKMAQATKIKVLSYMYRLSPEHVYPAAINDTYKAWTHLINSGYLPENIIVAGDSAGGNLALELILRLKKNKESLPAGLILMSPWTDMTLTSKSYEIYKDVDPVLDYEYMEDARRAYLGDKSDYKNPEYSPLFGDLSGFPKTLIQLGSNEILRDDSKKLSYRMKRRGVNVRTEIYRNAWHVFQNMPVISASRAMKNINSFIEGLKNE